MTAGPINAGGTTSDNRSDQRPTKLGESRTGCAPSLVSCHAPPAACPGDRSRRLWLLPSARVLLFSRVVLVRARAVASLSRGLTGCTFSGLGPVDAQRACVACGPP